MLLHYGHPGHSGHSGGKSSRHEAVGVDNWAGLVTSMGAELVGVVELTMIQPMRTDCLTDLRHWDWAP